MLDEITIVNIRDCLSTDKDIQIGEDELKEILSDFSCNKNLDVEKFLKEQAIEFTRKNQSITYLVFNNLSLVGYFTLTIKPITIDTKNFSKTFEKKIARVGKFDNENATYTLPAYLIAQLGKNFNLSPNELIDGKRLLQAAIKTIKQIQYMIGGMVVFLEAEDNDKLMCFYKEQNGFKEFDTRNVLISDENDCKLIQLLKII